MKYYKLINGTPYQSLFGIRLKDGRSYFLHDGEWEPWRETLTEYTLVSSGYIETTLKYLKLRGIPAYVNQDDLLRN